MDGSVGLEEALFSSALAMPSDERELYLQRACPDATLLARVQALLAGVGRAEILFEKSRLAQEPEIEDVGVENYQVLRELGEGGWGTVYLADQVLPIRRAVALKIIKLGMDTKAVILRFAAERQALAMMDHPNIAKVFDAGATHAGRPYFAMELVRGVRVTEYCDLTRAGVADRITIFLQVCQAIQHAHRRGVIHRDIKPSNVMVTLVDGMPTVKVIDFGVAKAIEGRISESTLFTAFDHFIGTPAYVSPEQAEFGGAQVTTRSDIYSLGILLYELLCGGTPFAGNDLSSSRLDLLRARIRSEEPLSPSSKLIALSPDAIARVSACSGTSRSRLIREVRGDLDWIVMHCLEKNPAKRYQTPHQLLTDLQSYLRDQPVVARPQRIAYLATKFAKRHSALLVNVVGLIAILISFTLITTLLALRAERANQLVQSVATFLQKDVWVQDDFADGGDSDVLLRIMLNQAADKVGARFSAEPLVEASLRGVLGSGYASLGSNEDSREQFERAFRIYEQQYGIRDPRTLETMSQIVTLMVKENRFEDAEHQGLLTLRQWESAQGTEHKRYLTLATTVALAQFQQGELVESRETLRSVLAAQRRVLGSNHQATLLSRMIIATVDLERRDLVEAEQFALSVVQGYSESVGWTHPRTRRALELLQRIYALEKKCGLLGPGPEPLFPRDDLIESVVVARSHIPGQLMPEPIQFQIRMPDDPWAVDNLLRMSPDTN
jgi:eukaryotic-like serine/threonine-protein kinase